MAVFNISSHSWQRIRFPFLFLGFTQWHVRSETRILFFVVDGMKQFLCQWVCNELIAGFYNLQVLSIPFCKELITV